MFSVKKGKSWLTWALNETKHYRPGEWHHQEDDFRTSAGGPWTQFTTDLKVVRQQSFPDRTGEAQCFTQWGLPEVSSRCHQNPATGWSPEALPQKASWGAATRMTSEKKWNWTQVEILHRGLEKGSQQEKVLQTENEEMQVTIRLREELQQARGLRRYGDEVIHVRQQADSFEREVAELKMRDGKIQTSPRRKAKDQRFIWRAQTKEYDTVRQQAVTLQREIDKEIKVSDKAGNRVTWGLNRTPCIKKWRTATGQPVKTSRSHPTLSIPKSCRAVSPSASPKRTFWLILTGRAKMSAEKRSGQKRWNVQNTEQFLWQSSPLFCVDWQLLTEHSFFALLFLSLLL